MPHTFGGLKLPVPIPTDNRKEATGDPFLDLLVSYLRAVINTECCDAWKHVAPGSPEPVRFTDTHNPGKEAFRANGLPALFAWRDNSVPRRQKLGSLDATVTNVTVLWVPPRTQAETRRVRDPFRNPIEKAIRKAFAKGRHPSWVVDGDTYYEPEYYGSVFLHHGGVSKLDVVEFQRQSLSIALAEGPPDVFDALGCILEITEVLLPGEGAYGDIASHRGSITVGGLPIQSYRFEPSLTSIVPAVGDASGDTTITVTGVQLVEGMTLTLGGVECRDVALADDTTLNAVTGAHAAGTVDLVARFPSGVTATLPDAFTYQ